MWFRKGLRTIGTAVLTFAMVASLVTPGETTAAKAPSFAKKTVNVKVGKTTTVKIKNVNKKAKVTWKIKSTRIAKLGKKSKTSVKVKGVKAGKTTLTAVYKLRKNKKTLKCSIVVKGTDVAKPTPVSQDSNTNQPTPTATQNVVNPTAVPTLAPTATPTAEPTEAPFGWTSTWGTAEEKNDISADSAMPKIPLAGTTIRQIIRPTTSGEKIRLRLSNQYGKSDVEIGSCHVAVQKPIGEGSSIDYQTSAIDTSTDTLITVDGSESFTIPAGEVIITDEIEFTTTALENLAISMYILDAPESNITGHRGARATTYQMPGNVVSEESIETGDTKTTTSWFFVSDVSIWTKGGKAVVCFGDSITDGYGTDASYLGKRPDSYTRWIDYFAKRLQGNEDTKHISVINEGIGSNAMFGGYPTDAGKDRFERDLLEHDNVAYCIILFGVNDLNKLPDTSKFESLKSEYETMIDLCRSNNIKVFAAPILPFGTSDYYSEGSEATRQLINNWFRSEDSGVDGIIDFEGALADPENPKNILEKYTHGDGLHPYDGYDVMADAINLDLFK